MISSRFAVAICALLAVALVPTLIHSYQGAVDDGVRADVIPVTLAGYQSAPSGRGERWGRGHFDSDDWIERNYTTSGDDVRLTVVRSFDLKALYHHPELAVAYGKQYGASFGAHEIVRLASAPQIPVHVLRPMPGGTALAMYVLHYNGEFVENPLWFQMRIAAELLVTRRQPMTLFFAHDLSAPGDPAIDTLPSVSLLLAAVEQLTAATRE